MIKIIKLAWSMEHGAQIAMGRTFVLKMALCKFAKSRTQNFSTNSPMPHAPCSMQKKYN
jgi:hypothetical protein